MTVYAVLSDGDIDQLCDDFDQAVIEAFDLMEMGCTVKLKKFENETKAYEWEEEQKAKANETV